MSGIEVTTTPIPGLLVVDLDVRGDNRGWFKENWQREKMVAAGLPDFAPVQNNISYNTLAGATRGIHAEPWDKLVSVATGEIFGAWVDLRRGPAFGTVFTLRMGPQTAVFVPRGVGNAFQTLVDGTAYSYLVNDHWSAAARDSYTFLNLADETVAIDWPIPLREAELSAADQQHPRLADVVPMPDRRTLILGAGGQLGRALSAAQPGATTCTRAELDLADPAAVAGFDFAGFDVVINAAAYTAVDAAETLQGRRDAWAANVTGVAGLVRAARAHRFTLVHISSDYVFDGTIENHTEDEPFSPLGVYGQTKAAGDALLATLPRHYVVRTSWVIGDGANFVRTMAALADREVAPQVVDDQFGRLTFTTEIVAAVDHLLKVEAPAGTYHLSGAGPVQTWAEIAADIYRARGRPGEMVEPISTQRYAAGQRAAGRPWAPRPRHSALDLTKLRSAGFEPRPAPELLAAYLASLPAGPPGPAPRS